MKKMINTETIEGYVYQHSLVIKTVQNQASANFGKEFITGNLEIATDENLLNVVPVHFTYVTAETASGKTNVTYNNLVKIIEGTNVISNGKDEALKVTVNTALALNDFYNQNGELVSAKVNEGGFVSFVNVLNSDETKRNKFEADMIITGTTFVEKDEEKKIEKDHLVIKGAIFNFRNELLPVSFPVYVEGGIKFFEDLDITNAEPVFTKVWGSINSKTVITEVAEESAFGEAIVKTYTNKTKEWEVTGTSMTPYEFGDERVLTADDLKTANQNRETMLAEVKIRNEEYQKSRGSVAPAAAPAPTTTVKKEGFTF